MRFVAIRAGALLAIDLAALNPKENTIDEVILKNYEAHKGGSPSSVLNLSEAVANRILELAPAQVISTETQGPAVDTVAPVVAPVVPVVETVASVQASNLGPIPEPGLDVTNPTSSSAPTSSSEAAAESNAAASTDPPNSSEATEGFHSASGTHESTNG